MSIEYASRRIPIGTFVEQLEAALKRKDGYIMGARGQVPRTGYLDPTVPESMCKSSWKPGGHMFTQYDGRQREKALYWRQHAARVWDCNGMAEGIYEILTGISIDSKARYNYRDWCSVKGSGTIPARYRVPGAAVFWGSSASSIHHVGYLYKPVKASEPEGDWYIIEARGVMYGVVKTRLSSRKPNFWGLMTKYYDYDSIPDTDGGCPYPEPSGTVRCGASGNAVRWVQWHLLKWRPDCLPRFGVDGDYGAETKAAVLDFKRARIETGTAGITAGNTNVGPVTREELKKYE